MAAYLALPPRPLTEVREGLAINLIAGVINGLWCYYLLREGRKLHSPACGRWQTPVDGCLFIAWGDCGIVLAAWLGIWWLDGALAILVAANILWSGYHVVQSSLAD